MANTDIKWFSFDNLNAPQLTNAWGCMIDVLDACLVTGFGSQAVASIVISDGVGIATFNNSHNIKQFQVIEFSGATESTLNAEFKVLGLTTNTIEFLIDLPDQTAVGIISCKLAPLGWTKKFSGAQKAVYQAKDTTANPYFLRIDNNRDPNYTDAYAKFAKVGILDACSGIDDLSGNQAPFNPSNPNMNWGNNGASSTSVVAGWFKWYYAMVDTVAIQATSSEIASPSPSARNWVLIGTKNSFYLIPRMTIAANYEIPYGFVAVQQKGVSKPALFAVRRDSTAGASQAISSVLNNLTSQNVATLLDYSGSVNSNLSSVITGFGISYSGSSINTLKEDPFDGFMLSPIYLLDANNYMIGELPIITSCPNNASLATNYSLMQNGIDVYLVCRCRASGNTAQGALFFKVYEGQ